MIYEFSKPLLNIQCPEYVFECHIHASGSESNHDPKGEKKWFELFLTNLSSCWHNSLNELPNHSEGQRKWSCTVDCQRKGKSLSEDKACRCTHKEALLSYISCKMQTAYEEGFTVNGVTQAGEALKHRRPKGRPCSIQTCVSAAATAQIQVNKTWETPAKCDEQC